MMIQNYKKIDRQSHVPSYEQLVQIIQEEIEAGRLRPGDKLPSESKLCSHNDISPMTVRRAIRILVEKNLVTTEQGRGTFVKPLQFWSSSFDLKDFQKILTDEKEVKFKTLEASVIAADENIAAKLKIKPDTRIIFARRLILVHDQPFIHHREHLIYDPTRQITESKMEDISKWLTEIPDNAAIPPEAFDSLIQPIAGFFKGAVNSFIKRGTHSLSPTILDEAESRLLGEEAATPAFYLESILYDFNDMPVSCGSFTIPGDRIKLTTVLGG